MESTFPADRPALCKTFHQGLRPQKLHPNKLKITLQSHSFAVSRLQQALVSFPGTVAVLSRNNPSPKPRMCEV
jgi:hypothetical protein